ncbi:MAG: DUF115 domain-containing protein [Lachnospiraceae bacterium]|nr:DUF115 domain-containing protein [Lachnospiraceae bacterium]
MNHSVFDKNIESMFKRDKHFTEEYLKLHNDNNVNNKINRDRNEVVPGSEHIDGREILYVQTKGKLYQLDSLYSSKIVMDLWCEQIKNTNFNAKLILFGLGNAMYIRTFLQKVPYTNKIIVYEPSFVIFEYVVQTFDIHDLIEDERIMFYIENINGCPDKEEMYPYFDFQDIRSILFLDYINYIILFPKQYHNFYIEVQKTVNTINAMDYVWERFGTAYYHNTLSNFPYFLNSYSILDLANKIPDGVPAILVSAGPSLDKNVEHLIYAKGKAFIISVDSALNALLKRNIVPDLFITVDGKKMETHFQDERIKMIPMVCNLVSNMSVVSSHTGKQFYISDCNSHIDKILDMHGKKLPIVESGGSVANSAYSFLELIGFKTIIMVGQDLAYTNNRTHAIDTVRGSWNLDITGEIGVNLEGYFGDVVKSSNEFVMYLDWFENEIRNKPNITMINATEGGAKIHGAVQMNFDEAIKIYCKKPINIQEIFDTLEKWLSKKEILTIANEFKNIITEVKSIRKDAEQVNLIYKKMLEKVYFDKYKSKEFFNMYQRAKDITEVIQQKDALYYVDCMMQDKMKQITDHIYELKDNEKEELIESISKSIEYMDAIVGTISEILPDMTRKIEDGIQLMGI